MDGPITSIDFLEDRVRISYHLGQPYGVPDEDKISEVLYSQIATLSKPPEISKNRTDANWNELIDIFIPDLGKTICFEYTSMRSGGGPPEECLSGPYLKE